MELFQSAIFDGIKNISKCLNLWFVFEIETNLSINNIENNKNISDSGWGKNSKYIFLTIEDSLNTLNS